MGAATAPALVARGPFVEREGAGVAIELPAQAPGEREHVSLGQPPGVIEPWLEDQVVVSGAAAQRTAEGVLEPVDAIPRIGGAGRIARPASAPIDGLAAL